MRMTIPARTVCAVVACLLAGTAAMPRASMAQVQADTAFDVSVTQPSWSSGAGPLVLLDEGHRNAHTVSGRYAPFVRLLRNDGYKVEPLRERFSAAALADARVLVIANAYAAADSLSAAGAPASAFTADEIAALVAWVRDGGSLLLIADHPPWAGAAEALALAFGVYFANGYAMRQPGNYENFVFQNSDGTLRDHPVTRGRRRRERVSAVASFTGQAFRAHELSPILVLREDVFLYLAADPRELSARTPRIRAGGMLQGAAGRFGRGRLAVFGEAALFSAQLLGPTHEPLGMNHPAAPQNKQFTLNVLHWLAAR